MRANRADCAWATTIFDTRIREIENECVAIYSPFLDLLSLYHDSGIFLEYTLSKLLERDLLEGVAGSKPSSSLSRLFFTPTRC